MIRLGIIGTGWISAAFADAVIAAESYQITSVFSRDLEKAQRFGEKYRAYFYETDLEKFLSSDEIEVVYIASPNSCHFKQAIMAIRKGKHIIVEKPAFSNELEMSMVITEAKKYGVLYFEAARHIHEANFATLKSKIDEIGEIAGANFTFMKRSSRYDSLLQGEEPNIFSLKYSGGALVDLGIYLIYACVSWFGSPIAMSYHPRLVRTGVDGLGIIRFQYQNFDVVMQTGKNADSFLNSEIYGSEGTIVFNGVAEIQFIEIHSVTGTIQTVTDLTCPRNMQEEAEVFAAIIKKPLEQANLDQYQYFLNLSVEVNRILSELRRAAGIIFEADPSF